MYSRTAEIGDMVIQRGDIFGKGPRYIGIVYKLGIVSGYDSVYLHWVPEDPPNYNKEYGYVRTNIANGHTQFEVIKK